MVTKRVESLWVPCLDAGSTPATSTEVENKKRSAQTERFYFSKFTIQNSKLFLSLI